MAKNRVASFIKRSVGYIEEVWGAIPGSAKVFFYATVSATIGLHLRGELDGRSVFVIVVTNLGLYQSPRIAGKGIKRMVKDE